MPSAKKQVNMRVDDATLRAVPLLVAAIESATGMVPSQADLFRLGIRELMVKYGVQSPEEPSKPKKK